MLTKATTKLSAWHFLAIGENRLPRRCELSALIHVGAISRLVLSLELFRMHCIRVRVRVWMFSQNLGKHPDSDTMESMVLFRTKPL